METFRRTMVYVLTPILILMIFGSHSIGKITLISIIGVGIILLLKHKTEMTSNKSFYAIALAGAVSLLIS